MKFTTYKSHLNRSKWLVTCQQCDDDLVRRPLIHLTHLCESHGFNKKTTCPWCLCVFHKRGLRQNVDHLDSCFARAREEGMELQKRYERHLACLKDPFVCDDCDETFTAKEYEKHVYQKHGAGCPWCRDPAPTGPEHWERCLEAFKETNLLKINMMSIIEHQDEENEFEQMMEDTIESGDSVFKNQSAPTAVCEQCASFDSDSERRSFFKVNRINDVHPSFYESFGEEEFRKSDWFRGEISYEDPYEENSFVAFDESSGLGFDAPSFLRKLIERRAVFFHVAVKAYAYESFYEAFRDSPRVGLLPYWCLCKGGSNQKKPALYTHHRHGIAVCASKEDFLNAFKQVKRSPGADLHHAAGQKCRCYWPIQSLGHLSSAICYLSNTKSMCTGKGFRKGTTVDWTNRGTRAKAGAHYYINRPVIPHGLFYLYMSFKGGINLYLNRRHGNRNVDDMPSLRKDIMFSVSLYDLPKDKEPKLCFPPLAHNLDYSPRKTSNTFTGLYKPNGEPIYLKRTNPRVDVSRRMFMSYHVGKDQGFVEQLNACRWTLTSPQQRYAHIVSRNQSKVCEQMKLQDDEHQRRLCLERKRWEIEKKELTKQNEDLSKRNEELTKQNEEKDREIYVLKIIQELKDQHAQEIKELKAEHTRYIQQLKDEHARDIRKSKDEHAQDVKELNCKIQDAKDESTRQIIKLKDEIRDLLKDQLKSSVREMREKENLHVEIKRVLENRFAEGLKSMEEKMELKDQITSFFRWIVDMLTDVPSRLKRKLDVEHETLKKRKD